MKSLAISKVDRSIAGLVNDVATGPLVFTRRGRPVAVLKAVEEGVAMESLSLSMNPKFLAIIEKSRQQYRAGLGITSDEMRKHLGLPRRGSATGKKK
jgi:hypothetical protein